MKCQMYRSFGFEVRVHSARKGERTERGRCASVVSIFMSQAPGTDVRVRVRTCHQNEIVARFEREKGENGAELAFDCLTSGLASRPRQLQILLTDSKKRRVRTHSSVPLIRFFASSSFHLLARKYRGMQPVSSRSHFFSRG